MSGVAAIDDSELTPAELQKARQVTKDVLQLGCALLPMLTREEVEAEMIAAGKHEWERLYDRSPSLKGTWPKFAAVIMSAAEPLFDDRMLIAAIDVERVTR